MITLGKIPQSPHPGSELAGFWCHVTMSSYYGNVIFARVWGLGDENTLTNLLDVSRPDSKRPGEQVFEPGTEGSAPAIVWERTHFPR